MAGDENEGEENKDDEIIIKQKNGKIKRRKNTPQLLKKE